MPSADPTAGPRADRPTGRPTARWYDGFAGAALDATVWLPHYLPAWSSRAEAAAAYHLSNGALVLDIPVDHPHWCAGDHEPPLRVSGLQTGSFSGPVGSTIGQQPFRDGLTVREEQPRFEGLLVDGGRVEVRCRADLSPRSMASLWMVGFEDRPERCGEICVVEVFGRSVRDGTAEIGCGLHAFRDPDLVEDFAAPRLPVDVSDWHTYAVTWDRAEAVFTVDGPEARRCPHPPTYPLQLMLAVFDFPEWSVGDDDHLVPSLTVDHVSWTPASPGATG
ncbi:glycosyl hydrolase family protein [Nocardioides guangzhouensis]|uniref:Glycosyl hydrolase family protein n=1 Tax=Nocardioides guangzhouensis TaxID=2497878 RepID=A0A4Q4Z1J2_9ACTN|nr:glycoside hydrolase family 16 protein [Nocardioides guangzhouensis]RYP81477.1 glycosyl hydrolase family protein [Nocardioides guangzhouensis]